MSSTDYKVLASLPSMPVLPKVEGPTMSPTTTAATSATTAATTSMPATHPAGGGLFGWPGTPPATTQAQRSPFGPAGQAVPPPPTMPVLEFSETKPGTKKPDSYDVAVWCSILLGVVLLGFWGILILRRYLRDPDSDAKGDVGFSLSELRAMRDRGEITPEEYEHTRAKVVASVRKSLEKKPAKKPPEEPPPSAV